MAYLKQRLETLLGHDVQPTLDTDEDTIQHQWAPGELVEVGEDYVGIDYRTSLFLFQIAHVISIQHSPRDCSACP